ncbi:TPA: hypothetical protein ACPJ0A_004225, partial [Vibrio diabolicus]
IKPQSKDWGFFRFGSPTYLNRISILKSYIERQTSLFAMLSKPCHDEVLRNSVRFLLNRVPVSSASFEPLCLLTKASFIITWKVYSLGYVIFRDDFFALDVVI